MIAAQHTGWPTPTFLADPDSAQRVRGPAAPVRAVVFQPLVSAQPDAVAISLHLAAAFARAAAWSVALIFRALRFRAEIRDVSSEQSPQSCNGKEQPCSPLQSNAARVVPASGSSSSRRPSRPSAQTPSREQTWSHGPAWKAGTRRSHALKRFSVAAFPFSCRPALLPGPLYKRKTLLPREPDLSRELLPVVRRKAPLNFKNPFNRRQAMHSA